MPFRHLISVIEGIGLRKIIHAHASLARAVGVTFLAVNLQADAIERATKI